METIKENNIESENSIENNKAILNMKKDLKKNRLEIMSFILFAFLLPLGCILLMKYTQFGKISSINFILFGIEAASPTIAALAVVLIFEKKKGMVSFFAQIIRRNPKFTHL